MNLAGDQQGNPYQGDFGLCAWVLLLALAVFGWGLHSKLSLYHVQPPTSVRAHAAKLLSERERTDEAAIDSTAPPQASPIAIIASAVVLVAPVQRTYALQSERPSLSLRTFVFVGPSFLRPPPPVSIA